MLVVLAKENDWEKLLNWPDTFGLFDYYEYFYHDRYEERLDKVKDNEKQLKKLYKEMLNFLNELKSDPTVLTQEVRAKMGLVYKEQMQNMKDLNKIVGRVFGEEVMEGDLQKADYNDFLTALFRKLNYPGMVNDWCAEQKFICEEIDRVNKKDSLTSEEACSLISEQVLKISEFPLTREQKIQLAAKCKNDQEKGLCNVSGEAVKEKHFSVGRRRFNLNSLTCWYSGEPLKKKHYRMYCFTRKYDGKHIYRKVNPDSREVHMDRCAASGKQIIGPYVRAMDKLWRKKEFKCAHSGKEFVEGKYVPYMGKPYLPDQLEKKLGFE